MSDDEAECFPFSEDFYIIPVPEETPPRARGRPRFLHDVFREAFEGRSREEVAIRVDSSSEGEGSGNVGAREEVREEVQEDEEREARTPEILR